MSSDNGGTREKGGDDTMPKDILDARVCVHILSPSPPPPSHRVSFRDEKLIRRGAGASRLHAIMRAITRTPVCHWILKREREEREKQYENARRVILVA